VDQRRCESRACEEGLGRGKIIHFFSEFFGQ
jgi:hypothetical protein